ncbi:terminase large subunit [Lachnospiraceae bacterium OttesenSCG-928-J05]|nr:terminase large subunit [Lachnospiraceae bacterium OttesenSCG-928-J05]
MHSDTNYIVEYHYAIKHKKVTVGKWIKLIYNILVTGLANGTWLYDSKKANKAINFIENYCHHSEGREDLLKLELWQKAIVCAIFGIMDKNTGRRQFREVFLVVARKNGKTLFASAIMAYMAYIDGEYGAKLYCLAPKLEQAELAFDAFYQMVQAEPELSDISKKRRSDIYVRDFNTTIKKIAFNSRKSDGFNPHFVLNDEISAWPGDQGLKQYDVMASAFGARTEGLMFSISTAGYLNDGAYDELFKRSTTFLNNPFKKDSESRILPFLYLIDDVEKWYTKTELKKSNPNLEVSVRWEFYQEQIKIAKKSLSKKAEFMTKYCNIKQNSAIAWLDYMDVEKAAGTKYTLEDFRGCYCVAGLDLSRTTDLTAATIVIERDDINYIFTKFFMPAKRYEKAINEDNVPYNVFLEQGYLELSGENNIDYRDVYNYMVELVKKYKIMPLKVGYDRYDATYIVQDLTAAGFHCDDVFQGTNLTPILVAFEGDLKDGKYRIGNNNLLKSHLLNVAVDINLKDSRMKPVKYDERLRIDGAASLFDALTVKDKYHDEVGRQLKNINAKKETSH